MRRLSDSGGFPVGRTPHCQFSDRPNDRLLSNLRSAIAKVDCRSVDLAICSRFAAWSLPAPRGAARALARSMTPDEMRDRTDRFAVEIVISCRNLPSDTLTRRLAAQLQDSGTSVAANYRAACRARSRAEFVAKLSIAVEEADESVLWLNTIQKARLATGDKLAELQQEAAELLSILAASRRTASRRRGRND